VIDELIGRFSAETFGDWCREKFDRFTADPHVIQDGGDFSKAAIVGYVQSLPDADTNRPLLVMSVYAGEQISERSSRHKQFDFARRQLQAAIDRPPAKVKGLFTQGLFAFHDSAGNFRLSLVSGRAEGKKLVYSDFKRQSFFVKPDRNNKTFRARMASPVGTYEQLTGAFSVETLTKAFYNELFAWYERAMAPASKVTFPNDLSRDDDDRNLLAEHLIRLITRLMFVWFIRQKDLVPEKLFDPTELKKLLKDFDPASAKQDNYYRAILQNLFFATLNCEIKERAFAVEGSKEENKEHYGIKTLYRYSEAFACSPEDVVRVYQSVPFLNGGLFECLDKQQEAGARSPVMYHDGFSREPRKCAHIPNNLFFDEHGLITLFARYDFTVDENAPNDSDVALDPELLGKVFENLLGAYNPETRETARKQSGSFYTPREIVNYMVDESLVAHLRTQAHEVEEPVLRLLLGGEEPPAIPNPLRHKLVAALYHCRILDPACGSGAFPMGLLLKMVHLLQRLDPNNTLWHEVVMAETEKALSEAETLDPAEKRLRRQRITESFDQNVNQPDYARKLYLIENCIFGVDIQPIAVQIAKLRAFITLVCDQEPDLTDAARNYRMLPLPNLETKFVAANSLIGLSTDFAEGLKPGEGGSRLDDAELVRLRAELAEVRHQHFRARNSSDKNACRKHDRELRGQIKTRLVEIACKPDAAKIAFYRAEIEKLQGKRKAVEHEEWKDVLQSRPQQGSLFDSAPAAVQTVMRVDVNKEARDRADDDLRRNTRAIEAEQNRVKNKSAFQKEADTLAAWDPYDQNASSPFFDPAWMFGFKSGFDIVIGNPPYVRQEDIREQKPALQAHGYVCFDGIADLFVYFYERGAKLLSDGGHLCYITSNKYFRAGYGAKLRSYLSAETRILTLIDFGDAPVFEAIAYPSIILAQRAAPAPSHALNAFTWTPGPDISEFPALFRERAFHVPQSGLRADGWQLERPEVLALLDKLRAAGTPLGEYVRGKFYRGVLTGLNEAFVVDRATRDRLIAEHPSSAEILKPFLRGRDVKRWRCQFADKYLIKIESSENKKHPWSGKPAAKAESVFKQEYPAIHRFLTAHRKALVERCDQGKYFWELRSCIYWQEFESPKILWPDIAQRAEFAYDNEGNYLVNTLYLLPCTNKWLLSILNSATIWWFYSRISNQIRGGFVRYIAQYVSQIPVPATTLGQQAELNVFVDRILAAKASDPAADVAALEAEIDRLVYAFYNLTPDEIAIVEGRGASEKGTAVAAKPAKAPAARQPRKSVMTEDPDLS
jgi:hypothetical protein